jgi:hypothetical protein
VSSNEIDLSWSAYAAAPCLAGYDVYSWTGTAWSKLKQIPITTLPDPLHFAHTGLPALSMHYYTIDAYDRSGNTSPQYFGYVSAQTLTTGAAPLDLATPPDLTPVTDKTPPSVPSGLHAVASSATQINLTWNAATDPDSSVAGYNVYRWNGSSFVFNQKVLGQTSAEDSGLNANTPYYYTVAAFDPAATLRRRPIGWWRPRSLQPQDIRLARTATRRAPFCKT